MLSSALQTPSRDRKLVLVIDNFEQVHDEQLLVGLVSLVARHRHFHLLVCCKGHHPIESVAAGRVQVNAIEPRELLFEIDEIVELARAMGSPVERAEAERLYAAVGGCVSMLRMALTSPADCSLRHAVVEDYVRTQLLGDVGYEDLLRHLSRFALPRSFTWPLFRDLCEDPDPARLLEDLEATGLVERTSAGEEVDFTVPTAVRRVLRDQYSSSAPEESREFHRHLAGWFAAHSEERHLALAFHHAVAGRDWDLMDELWAASLAAMVCKDFVLVGQTLLEVPTEVLATRPSMQVMRDISKIAIIDSDADGRRATIRAYADSCARLVKQRWESIPVSELLILATGYMMELRLVGRLQDSVAFGERVNAKATAFAATETLNKARFAWFQTQRGLSLTLINDEVNAVRSYRRAWEYATGSGADFVQYHAASNLALTYALEGDAPKAREWLRRHHELDSLEWPGKYVIGIGARVAEGLLALDRLDEAGTRSQLEYLGNGLPVVELWPFIAYLFAQHALHRGKAAEALVQLAQVQAAIEDGESKGVAAALVCRARADLLISCGRGENVKRMIQASGVGKRWSRVPAARLRFLSGESARELDPLTWDPGTSLRDRLEMLLLGAAGALRNDDQRNAQRLTNQALDLYKETGMLRPFVTIPRADREQLLELADWEMDPGDKAILDRASPVYPDRLVFVELSEHEYSVLKALATTPSRQAIADSLFVSVNTIKTQLASIYQKFGTTTRAETLAKAKEHELLTPAAND